MGDGLQSAKGAKPADINESIIIEHYTCEYIRGNPEFDDIYPSQMTWSTAQLLASPRYQRHINALPSAPCSSSTTSHICNAVSSSRQNPEISLASLPNRR